METWAIVTLVLGSSAISALLTFLITRMQVNHSDTRFIKELERAREVDLHKRRWEVRGEPLLKLREELAEVALWSERLITTMGMIADAFKKRARLNGEDKLYEESYQHLNAYIQSGVFEKTLYCIGDKEIREKALTLSSGYTNLWSFVKNNFVIENPPDLSQVIESTKIIAYNVIELQVLINDRLEKL